MLTRPSSSVRVVTLDRSSSFCRACCADVSSWLLAGLSLWLSVSAVILSFCTGVSMLRDAGRKAGGQPDWPCRRSCGLCTDVEVCQSQSHSARFFQQDQTGNIEFRKCAGILGPCGAEDDRRQTAMMAMLVKVNTTAAVRRISMCTVFRNRIVVAGLTSSVMWQRPVLCSSCSEVRRLPANELLGGRLPRDPTARCNSLFLMIRGNLCN